MDQKAISFSDKLETHSFLTKIVRLFTVPLLNSIPSSLLQGAMKKTSRDAETVVHKGGSTHALEAMYTRYHRGFFSRGIKQGISDIFWHHLVSQPKAIRNRLRIVKELLRLKASSLVEGREDQNEKIPVSILSIAGGSSRSLIHMIADMHGEGIKYPIEVITIDKDKSALDIGEKVARENSVSECFRWVVGKANEVDTLVPGKQFDVIEIVGLLDYFPKERAVRLIQNVKKVLRAGGCVIAANVTPNSEMVFVRKTGWPEMQYRSPKEFEEIFHESGFTQVSLRVEPLGVHMIITAQ